MLAARLLVPLLAVAVTAAPQAPSRSGGTIRGRVAVPTVGAPLSRPAVAEPPGAAHVPVNRRRVVVYLESAPRQAFGELAPGRARMNQRAEQFVPRVLAVTAGTTVDFPNNDKTFHNVFSLSRVRSFDLGRFAPGRTGSVRFDRSGIVPVFCDIHSHMSAFVVVFTHRFFRVTDTDGRYRLDQVPPGTYTVVGWYEGEARVQRSVTVAPGATVELDLEVP